MFLTFFQGDSDTNWGANWSNVLHNLAEKSLLPKNHWILLDIAKFFYSIAPKVILFPFIQGDLDTNWGANWSNVLHNFAIIIIYCKKDFIYHKVILTLIQGDPAGGKAHLHIREDNLMLDNFMFDDSITDEQYRQANRSKRKCSKSEKKWFFEQNVERLNQWQYGREPWSSGYVWRLVFRRPWVRIPLYWMDFFTFICCNNCNVCPKRRK